MGSGVGKREEITPISSTVCVTLPVQSADRASGTLLSDRGLLLVGVWAGSSPPATLPFPPHAGAAASC